VTVTDGVENAALDVQLMLLVVGADMYATEPLGSTGTVALGREPDSDVHIDDPSISRNHALIHLDPPLRIEDLGSSNGTWVREQKIAPNTPCEIQLNEPVRVGHVTIVVHRRPNRLRLFRLHDHDYFESRVADECARTVRSGGNFAIVHAVLDRPLGETRDLLAATLRTADVVAEYAPNEVEILLVDTSPPAARLAQERLERALAGRAVDAKIGVACFPLDGRDPSTLAGRARTRAVGDARVSEREPVIVDERMTLLYEVVGRVAASDITVLLLGETGAGKEVIAETIHRRSARADKPFVRLNCGALAETLLESELFGHERGAFTGATDTKVGLLEVAQGGVVFLDEVGELQPATQVKLLRVLDERMVMRVGAVKPRPIDVRVVAATNRDLDEEVRLGRFRLDLLYRLNAMSIIVPPLRERVAEIAPLARVFLRRIAAQLHRPVPRLAADALALLESYSWPGNIRELRNVIERAVVLCTGDEIGVADLPEERMRTTFSSEPARPPAAVSSGDTPDAVERRRILAALEECAGNQTNAAKLLNISRRTLINKIEKLAVPRPRKK
jgi:DNA-binding NtrC family response regulator